MDPALLAGCQQFEAVMLRPLFEQLRFGQMNASEISGSGRSGDDFVDRPGAANDLIHSMFADVLALAFARAGGVGLATRLAGEIERTRR
jgi:hypothetical protein